MGMTSVAVQSAKQVTELRRLLDQGKDRGFLTLDEINASLAQNDLETSQVDDLMEVLVQEGIEVVYKLASAKSFASGIGIDEPPIDEVPKRETSA